MKNWNYLLLAILIFTGINAFASSSKETTVGISLLPLQLSLPDSVILDTIDFRDMYDEYSILQYKVNGNIVQMDIDRKGSFTDIDYIIWDMDKDGKLEAIGVYNVLDQKFEYHLIEEPLNASDLLDYLIQLEDIGFPSFYDSSAIPKAVYKSKQHQPILNYYK